MKIIHTGDIHIGTGFAYLPPQKARIRSREMIETFHALLRFASAEKVEAVLIAGDLWDSARVDGRIKEEVFYLIESAQPVQFYYIQGNHDEYAALHGLPDNLHLFAYGKGFQSYEIGENICITGVNTSDFCKELFASLRLDEQKYNILTLHGDITRADEKEGIPLEALKNRRVDYLALGHIHKPMERAERLDGRGKYRYCGCLEGRGFDECGKRGAFLLDIKNGYIAEEKFLSFAKREVLETAVDISSAKSYYDLEREVFSALVGKEKDTVKVVLTGRRSPTLKRELSLLKERVNERCFFARIEDESRIALDIERLKNEDVALAEFINEAGRYEMNDEMRREVLEIGIKAISGEEIDL